MILLKCVLYIFLIIIFLLSILKIKKEKSKKKNLYFINALICVILILCLLSCQSILIPSVIKAEISEPSEFAMPQQIVDAVKEANTIELFGEQVNVTPKIVFNIKDGDNYMSDITVKGYRFENIATAEQVAVKLMTESSLHIDYLDSILYTFPNNHYEKEEYDDFSLRYIKEPPSYWARQIIKTDKFTVYSTPTAITLFDFDAISNEFFIGRLPGASYFTVFAVQQNEYVYIFTEQNYAYTKESSFFKNWSNMS